MTKNNLEVMSASALGSFGISKLTQSTVDPYTRFAAGALLTLAISSSSISTIRYAGFGVGIASLLQLWDIKKGGRLTFNKASKKVFVLDEERGAIELNPFEIPKYNVDGITVEGMNGVFKISDGVYAGVTANNSIRYSFGLGELINKGRDAGFKTKLWVDSQNERWKSLFEKSI